MNEDCLKLTSYFGELDRVHGGFLSDVLMDIFERRRFEVSLMMRGTEGFGVKHRLQTQRLLTLSEDLPLVSIAVDSRERIEAALDEVIAATGHHLLTLERARLLSGHVERVRLPEQLHEATKLTVYVGRRQRAGGKPAYKVSLGPNPTAEPASRIGPPRVRLLGPCTAGAAASRRSQARSSARTSGTSHGCSRAGATPQAAA